jgi:hypothetical protein
VQDVLTVPASLAGLPALSVPGGLAGDDGWPVGVSVVGQWGADDFVLEVGGLVEGVVGEIGQGGERVTGFAASNNIYILCFEDIGKSMPGFIST